jgi:hypothetical protein
MSEKSGRESEPPRFGISPRHCCEIDAKRRRQRAVSGQLLTPSQAAARDIGCEGFDDAPANGAIAVSERRDPIRTFVLLPVDCIVTQPI